MPKKFSQSVRNTIFRKSGGECWYCGNAVASEVEHQQPQAVDGLHELDNLVGACIECNRRKAGHGVPGNPNWNLEEYREQVAAALGIPPRELLFYGERYAMLRQALLEHQPQSIHSAIMAGQHDELLTSRPEPLPEIKWDPPYVYKDDSL